jgi:hypothetical protein
MTLTTRTYEELQFDMYDLPDAELTGHVVAANDAVARAGPSERNM